MIKNLITGPGFVASHLADLLLEKGEEVYVTYRWTDNQDSFKHIKDKVNWVLMDLNDLSSCLKVIENVKPDLEAVRIIRNNIGRYTIPQNTDWKYNPTIHVCSSSEVYGLVTENLVPITEECRFNPSNPYAVSKVGEDMIALMYYTNYGLKIIRTRMFTHTGPRRTMLSAEVAFAKQIAEFEKDFDEITSLKYSPFDQENNNKVLNKEYILKHGNLDSVRTWADVRDACKAYYILVRKGEPGEVYNIGGKTTKTIGEMLDYLISLSPLKNKIIKKIDPKLLRPYDVTLQIPDCYKFIKKTGWKREIPFEKTMKDLLNWWRENV